MANVIPAKKTRSLMSFFLFLTSIINSFLQEAECIQPRAGGSMGKRNWKATSNSPKDISSVASFQARRKIEELQRIKYERPRLKTRALRPGSGNELVCPDGHTFPSLEGFIKTKWTHARLLSGPGSGVVRKWQVQFGEKIFLITRVDRNYWIRVLGIWGGDP